MSLAQLRIGTSGWIYGHWQRIFYPAGLSGQDKLKYFSQHFKTVEINYSFYRLPRPKTYKNWYRNTPKYFLFAVKVSRFITHIKRLKRVGGAWKNFLENALNLKEKLGPFLFQFPPSFKADRENIERLNFFLKSIRKNYYSNFLGPKTLSFACEFRHKSWFSDKIYTILKKYNVAWVIADSPVLPKTEEVTADFTYLRMHGSKILFSSNYTEKELKNLAQKIKKWRSQKLNIYVYFNNDAEGFAILNARKLLELCTNRK